MESATSLEGNCPMCQNTWTEAVTGTQCCFGGYRKFLTPGSRGRQRRVRVHGHIYEYARDEPAPPPPKRSNGFARRCLAISEAIGRAYRGHKFTPLPARWAGFEWIRFISLDFMHGNISPYLPGCLCVHITHKRLAKHMYYN